MGASVQDRVRELATLRAMGYSGMALARAIAQESVLIACLGGLVGVALARLFLVGNSVTLAMSAFSLDLDAVSILAGFAASVLLGLLGSGPAALRVSRLPIIEALAEN